MAIRNLFGFVRCYTEKLLSLLTKKLSNTRKLLHCPFLKNQLCATGIDWTMVVTMVWSGMNMKQLLWVCHWSSIEPVIISTAGSGTRIKDLAGFMHWYSAGVMLSHWWVAFLSPKQNGVAPTPTTLWMAKGQLINSNWLLKLGTDRQLVYHLFPTKEPIQPFKSSKFPGEQSHQSHSPSPCIPAPFPLSLVHSYLFRSCY